MHISIWVSSSNLKDSKENKHRACVCPGSAWCVCTCGVHGCGVRVGACASWRVRVRCGMYDNKINWNSFCDNPTYQIFGIRICPANVFNSIIQLIFSEQWSLNIFIQANDYITISTFMSPQGAQSTQHKHSKRATNKHIRKNTVQLLTLQLAVVGTNDDLHLISTHNNLGRRTTNAMRMRTASLCVRKFLQLHLEQVFSIFSADSRVSLQYFLFKSSSCSLNFPVRSFHCAQALTGSARPQSLYHITCTAPHLVCP